MPLFRSNQAQSPPPPPPPSQSPTRSRTLFSRRNNSPSPTYDDYNGNSTRSGGFFSGRRSSSSSSGDHRGGFANGDAGLRNDPSIRAARQKVTDAEVYEREADRALGAARAAVRDAREHVRMLEREALEDARRAKAKQAEAKTVSKSARGLGRHG